MIRTHRRLRGSAAALLSLLLLGACSGGGDSGNAGGTDRGGPKHAALRLAGDPGTALSILDAKQRDPGGEEVVLVGRVLRIVPGYAAFALIDQRLDYCGSGSDPMDDCPTPWDYCCIAGEETARHTLLVEARDAAGAPLPDALEDLRLLDLVVAKGKLEKDENGNVTLVASGWFRRERPALREGLSWPER